MTDPGPILVPHPAFTDLSVGSGAGDGVTITARETLGIASVNVRKGRVNALTERVRDKFNLALPRGPSRVCVGELAFVGTGPGAWLAIFEGGGHSFVGLLRACLGEFAAMTDQTDSYALLQITGPKVRESLSKLVPIDVHPLAFNVNDVAVTSAAHMGVILWRLHDQSGGGAVFEIAVSRSMAGSFWHVLVESASEFGIEKRG
jgi:methylglutamate dehydrogenase subunit D